MATNTGCAGLVSVTTTPPPTTVNITNVQANATTTSTSQITWITDVASNSVVNYGTTTSYGSSTPVDSTMVTSHQVAVSGLSAGTTYYYQVQSTDSKNNNGKSGGHKFATQGVSISGTITPTKGGSGATVTLSGAASASTTANSSGAYTFTGLASGSYVVTPSNAGYTFTPANQTVTAGTTNVTGVNFAATGNVVAPSITTQPASQTVTAGQTATFSVVATGTAPLTYQWEKNGANIAGATSATYTMPTTATSDTGSTFVVVVSNSAGTATSNAASLTVNPAPLAPSITTQPVNQTVTAGQTATFIVVAGGTAPLTYQWQKNGANIPGATSASYTTPATTTADSGSTFLALVSNSAGTATSNAATLTVNPAPVAPAITTQPTNQTVTAGQTATFTVTASGTAPLSYQWQKNGGNIAGATSASYTTPATTTSDNGSTFKVVVTNTTGTATSNSATLTVNAAVVAPSITTQPINQAVTVGQTATFIVVASGSAPLTYQWQKNGANITGATSASYTTPATTTADSGSTFKAVVTNSAGSATSNVATLTVNVAAVAPLVTTQPVSQTVTAGQTATFTVVASGTAPLTYQWQKNGANITGAASASYTTPATTTSDSGSTFVVVVSNSAGTATSSVATLTVNPTSSSNGAPTCGISRDSSNHIPTDWNTFVPPARGQSYVDSTFGCTVTRITDVSSEVWSGSFYLPITHGYATVSPFNANDTYLMLADGWNRHFVTDLLGNVVVPSGNMPGMNDTWVLWDAANAGVFYYTNGNSLMKGTISGSSVTAATVHQFSEYAAINFMDETDVSQDGAHVVIVGGDTSGSSAENVFDYNFVSNTKGPVYTTACTGSVGGPNNGCLHKLIQTPDNNVIIQFAGDGSGPEQGNRLWTGGTPLPTLQDATNHLDAGSDLNGNAVFIESGNGTYTPGLSNPCPSGWGLDVRQIYNVLSSVCLLDNLPSWHVGYRGNAQQPWVGLSFFDVRGSGPEWFDNSLNFIGPTASSWQLYEDEIMAVRIDANNNSNYVYRLARGYSRSSEDFNATPKAAISRDGKYMAFDSNMAYAHTGCPSNFQTSTNCIDVYVIKVQ